MGSRGIIVSSQIDIEPSSIRLKNSKLELHLNLIELFSDIQHSTQKIVELLKLDLIKLESIKKLINNYI